MKIKAIDLFAGIGGFTEGARQAGISVAWAANHWRAAVDAHSINHRETEHACQDLQQADWTAVPSHDVGLASPCCQGHSDARGKDSPHHDASRSTAWAIVSCAEVHRERLWIVENVPEFMRWALFPAWKSAMETLGYSLSPHVVDAADCGVPQHRVRLFIVCTRSRSPLKLTLPVRDHVPADSIIDVLSADWSPVRTKCEKTRARVKRGRAEFGNRFLIPYYGSGSGLTGRSLDRPIGTITTRDRWALVEGDQMRMLNVAECRRAMGFPDTYHLPSGRKLAKHMLGNAVCPPVVRDILTAALQAA